MESMKALTAWMAEMTHIVSTGPFGMTAAQRQFLDGQIKTIQMEVKQFEEDRKRWEAESIEVKGETAEFDQPADLLAGDLAKPPPLADFQSDAAGAEAPVEKSDQAGGEPAHQAAGTLGPDEVAVSIEVQGAVENVSPAIKSADEKPAADTGSKSGAKAGTKA